MSRENLDDHLRRHYGSQEIDQAILARLTQLADLHGGGRQATDAADHRSVARRRFRHRCAVAVAAAALILLSVFFRDLQGGDFDALAGSILREVALNHSKNLEVEFAAAAYPQLREQMAELDFPLRAPQRLAEAGLRMLGGRYCSIQGRLAAQIKVENEDGRMLTLYQASFDEHFEGLPELQREQGGVQIRIWREADLLFALAGFER
ncbi:MAG: hypothetical protein CL933_11975 [Deltaproteobacteria bacterium]|nr:hypothetical protein [Deltaproteobacteria bacterium]